MGTENKRLSDKISQAVVEGRLLAKTRKKLFNSLEERIDFFIGRQARKSFVGTIPIQDDLIALCSFQGEYTDNPKYIADELARRYPQFKLVWIGDKTTVQHAEDFPEHISAVYEWWTYEAYVALAAAKVLVLNSVELFKRPWPKKEGQYIIETWHGSLGIKRFDREVNSGKSWVRAADYCGQVCDYLISNSSFESEIYRTSFWPNTEILEYGHPRNDVLLTCSPEQIAKTRKKVFSFLDREDHGEKLALYAPTFRDAHNFDCYDLDADRLTCALQERFGGEWLALYRYHHTARKHISGQRNAWHSMADVTFFPDMQELLLIADVGITDYSSWIYDYMLMGRPGFIYATDIALYNNERGFAYPLEDTPFPLAADNETMLQNVKAFDVAKYKEEVASFLAGKGCVEDGHASERVADKIRELIEQDCMEG